MRGLHRHGTARGQRHIRVRDGVPGIPLNHLDGSSASRGSEKKSIPARSEKPAGSRQQTVSPWGSECRRRSASGGRCRATSPTRLPGNIVITGRLPSIPCFRKNSSFDRVGRTTRVRGWPMYSAGTPCERKNCSSNGKMQNTFWKSRRICRTRPCRQAHTCGAIN